MVGVSCTDRSMEMHLLNNPINSYLPKAYENCYVHFDQIARFLTVSPLSKARTLALRRLFLSRSYSTLQVNTCILIYLLGGGSPLQLGSPCSTATKRGGVYDVQVDTLF